MHDPRPAPASPALATAAHAAGFRSVEVVRVLMDGPTAVANVTGVLHRYPRTVPVSLATATRLVNAGAPVRVDHLSSARAQQPVFVCSCLAVTHRTIGAAVAAGASTVEEVTARCRAGGRCGGCWPELQRLVDAHHEDAHAWS